MSAFDTSDFGVFLSDFGTVISPVSWGTGDFRGIVDVVEVEVAGGNLSTSRFRRTVLTASANIPTGAVTGDQVQVDGTTYKIVDFQETEPGATLLILARVS